MPYYADYDRNLDPQILDISTIPRKYKTNPNAILPHLVACFSCSSRGLFIFKIESKFYATTEQYRSIQNNTIRLQCRHHRSTKCKKAQFSRKKCNFIAYLKMVKYNDPSLVPLSVFYDISNFAVESSFGVHTCDGYNTVLDAHSSTKFKGSSYGIRVQKQILN